MGKRFAFGTLLLDARMGTLSRDGRVLAVGQSGLLFLRSLLEATAPPRYREVEAAKARERAMERFSAR